MAKLRATGRMKVQGLRGKQYYLEQGEAKEALWHERHLIGVSKERNGVLGGRSSSRRRYSSLQGTNMVWMSSSIKE